MFQALLGDKISSSTKLDLLILIEEEATSLLSDADSIKLAITAFRVSSNYTRISICNTRYSAVDRFKTGSKACYVKFSIFGQVFFGFFF